MWPIAVALESNELFAYGIYLCVFLKIAVIFCIQLFKNDFMALAGLAQLEC